MSPLPQPHSFLVHHQDPLAGPQTFLAFSALGTLPHTVLSALSTLLPSVISQFVACGPFAPSHTGLGAPCPNSSPELFSGWPPFTLVVAAHSLVCFPTTLWDCGRGWALLGSASSASGMVPGMEWLCHVQESRNEWIWPRLWGLWVPVCLLHWTQCFRIHI